MIKAAVESGTSFKADPFESDSIHCPFNKRHGVPIFRYYSQHPEHASRFAKAMAGWRRSNELSPFSCLPFYFIAANILTSVGAIILIPHTQVEKSVTELRDNFPWADLRGTVVDIGGGSGHVSIILARVSRLSLLPK